MTPKKIREELQFDWCFLIVWIYDYVRCACVVFYMPLNLLSSSGSRGNSYTCSHVFFECGIQYPNWKSNVFNRRSRKKWRSIMRKFLTGFVPTVNSTLRQFIPRSNEKKRKNKMINTIQCFNIHHLSKVIHLWVCVCVFCALTSLRSFSISEIVV